MSEESMDDKEPSPSRDILPHPKTLSRPEGAVYIYEIEDPDERRKAFHEWLEGLKEFASSVDPGILKREDYYK
jgi:hypothetical protein